MDVFIVRPFGEKQGVDFNKVETDLIQPAMKLAGITGSTTAAIVEAGNIREDMFSKLLTADIVIADLSVHNANVFYELGIRHSLRDKRTFLIRCSKDEIPFDLKTDRYLSYNEADLAASIDELANGLKATILSERHDSPVFHMLPNLKAQDPEQFLAVPKDFGEEVEIARVSRQLGLLALLASEAEGFPWSIPGIRSIAEVQFRLKAFEEARISWEKIRSRYPQDDQANDRLATIYQRLAETELKTNPDEGMEMLAKSDLAIKRLLQNNNNLNREKRAEIFALMGRNEKVRWLDAWIKAAQPDRQKKALQSPFLMNAYKHYDQGFNEDLNHYYAGINALALLTVSVVLAEQLPGVWELEYETEEDAAAELKKYKAKLAGLITVVQKSISATKMQMEQSDKTDVWLNMTEADLACLISKNPERVNVLYKKVLSASNDLNMEAARKQLEIYDELGILSENVQAALGAFAEIEYQEEDKSRHYILFTGHMIDKPEREVPRFPAAKEAAVKAAIKEMVQKEKEKAAGAPLMGIAGGACGGDILFHEACEELGIPTELYLAIPREPFIKASVQFAGPEWIERFNRLYRKPNTHILSETGTLPGWLQKKTNYTIWVRNNLWMLHSALVCGGMNLTLLSLWDGQGGDGPGGTAHMVKEAAERGAKTINIDPGKV